MTGQLDLWCDTGGTKASPANSFKVYDGDDGIYIMYFSKNTTPSNSTDLQLSFGGTGDYTQYRMYALKNTDNDEINYTSSYALYLKCSVAPDTFINNIWLKSYISLSYYDVYLQSPTMQFTVISSTQRSSTSTYGYAPGVNDREISTNDMNEDIYTIQDNYTSDSGIDDFEVHIYEGASPLSESNKITSVGHTSGYFYLQIAILRPDSASLNPQRGRDWYYSFYIYYDEV